MHHNKKTATCVTVCKPTFPNFTLFYVYTVLKVKVSQYYLSLRIQYSFTRNYFVYLVILGKLVSCLYFSIFSKQTFLIFAMEIFSVEKGFT